LLEAEHLHRLLQHGPAPSPSELFSPILEWPRGAAYLLAEGVAEHPIKADTGMLFWPRVALVITIMVG